LKDDFLEVVYSVFFGVVLVGDFFLEVQDFSVGPVAGYQRLSLEVEYFLLGPVAVD
tara:strand:+ start:108 stop:275 length:168 start_codon:yes stop_codon:yes gene_type:complete